MTHAAKLRLPDGYRVWTQMTTLQKVKVWNWRCATAQGEFYTTEREAIEAAIRHAEIEAQS